MIKREKIAKLEWYVLNHDFNGDKIESFNIFRNSKFIDGVESLLKGYETHEEFVEGLEKLAMYCFWCKAEYEILCCGLFSKNDKVSKIDVYSQLKPNIEILARYIISEYNKMARKKIEEGWRK